MRDRLINGVRIVDKKRSLNGKVVYWFHIIGFGNRVYIELSIRADRIYSIGQVK